MEHVFERLFGVANFLMLPSNLGYWNVLIGQTPTIKQKNNCDIDSWTTSRSQLYNNPRVCRVIVYRSFNHKNLFLNFLWATIIAIIFQRNILYLLCVTLVMFQCDILFWSDSCCSNQIFIYEMIFVYY